MPKEGNVQRPTRSTRTNGRSVAPSQPPDGETKDVPVVALSFRFRKNVHDRLRVYCFVSGVSQNEFVSEAVEGRLQEVMDGIMEMPIRTLLDA